MKDLRTTIENNQNIKKINDVLVFEALRSYNINHEEKVLLKGGRLYNLLTGDKSSFDIDVQYNKRGAGIRDLEELKVFFSNYFDKKFECYKCFFKNFTDNITIKSIISRINMGDIYVLKFSYCLNERVFIPFFEITCSNFVSDFWEYSYGIYCILPSQLILNLMDMGSQTAFHKSYQCRERLSKMIEMDYLKYYFNMDKDIFLRECQSQSDVPRECSVLMRSYEELLDAGYSLTKITEIEGQLKGLGVLEKYLFLRDGKVSFHYRLKEYEKFIEVFEDAKTFRQEEFLEKYERNNKKFLEMTSLNEVTKFYDLTVKGLLEQEVFYFKYTSNLNLQEPVSIRRTKPSKKIISPIIVFSAFEKMEKIYKKNECFSFKELNENENYLIQTKFKKSIDGKTELKISRNCLGVEPTLCVIFPINNTNNNIVEINNKEIYYSRVLCLKKRKVFFKTMIDRKVLLEPINLVILKELP